MRIKISLSLTILLSLLFTLSSMSIATPPKYLVLQVTSEPTHAAIYLDQKFTGKYTPCKLDGLSIGTYQLELRKKNYRTEKRKIKLSANENNEDFLLVETSLYYMWLCLPALLLGAAMTLFLTLIAVFNGIILGTIAGIAKVIHNKTINLLAGIYVDFIRGTPLLVQIFMIHFGLPPLLGNLFSHGQPIPLNPFFSAILALSINSGAYVAEIMRAGIQSIDKGQMEAARSLGMTYRQAMRFIILPQAIKQVIPPLGNEFIAMLKDSSLVSVIGMEELVRKAQIIVTRSYRPTETWLEVGLIFLLMTIPFTRLVSWLERRLKTND